LTRSICYFVILIIGILEKVKNMLEKNKFKSNNIDDNYHEINYYNGVWTKVGSLYVGI